MSKANLFGLCVAATLLIKCVFNVRHVLVSDTDTDTDTHICKYLLLHNSCRNSLSNWSNFKLLNCLPRHVIYGTSQLLVVT